MLIVICLCVVANVLCGGHVIMFLFGGWQHWITLLLPCYQTTPHNHSVWLMLLGFGRCTLQLPCEPLWPKVTFYMFFGYTTQRSLLVSMESNRVQPYLWQMMTQQQLHVFKFLKAIMCNIWVLGDLGTPVVTGGNCKSQSSIGYGSCNVTPMREANVH